MRQKWFGLPSPALETVATSELPAAPLYLPMTVTTLPSGAEACVAAAPSARTTLSVGHPLPIIDR